MILEPRISHAARAFDKLIFTRLLSMETVRLAKIDNFIRAELAERAEYAIKFGVSAPRRHVKVNKK